MAVSKNDEKRMNVKCYVPNFDNSLKHFKQTVWPILHWYNGDSSGVCEHRTQDINVRQCSSFIFYKALLCSLMSVTFEVFFYDHEFSQIFPRIHLKMFEFFHMMSEIFEMQLDISLLDDNIIFCH